MNHWVDFIISHSSTHIYTNSQHICSVHRILVTTIFFIIYTHNFIYVQALILEKMVYSYVCCWPLFFFLHFIQRNVESSSKKKKENQSVWRDRRTHHCHRRQHHYHQQYKGFSVINENETCLRSNKSERQR